MQKICTWYAHILFYLVAYVYACTCTSAKAQPEQRKNKTFLINKGNKLQNVYPQTG